MPQDVVELGRVPRLPSRPTATAAQCRAARALLKWTQRRLAREAQVARKTIGDFECECRPIRYRTRLDITRTLEVNGIEFNWTNGQSVRLLARCTAVSVAPLLHKIGESVPLFV